jgi:hypothetical protein
VDNMEILSGVNINHGCGNLQKFWNEVLLLNVTHQRSSSRHI